MSESAEQIALFQLLGYQANRYPEYDLIYAVPNGGYRTPAEAGRFRAEGVKKGVPDLVWPIARGGWFGAYFEHKLPDGKLKEDQRWWLRQLSAQGYRVAVFWSIEEGMKMFDAYYKLPPTAIDGRYVVADLAQDLEFLPPAKRKR